MNYLTHSLKLAALGSLLLIAGCGSLQADTRTEAQKYPCGRPSMPGADVICPQGEAVTIVLLPSRTNADIRGLD